MAKEKDIIYQEQEAVKKSLFEKQNKLFAERIDNIIKLYGWKASTVKHELSARTGYDYRQISNFFSGNSPCPSIVLTAICDYFSGSDTEDPKPDKNGDVHLITVDYLLGRTAHTSLGNEYISRVTGLSDTAIDKLQALRKSDNSIRNKLCGHIKTGNVLNKYGLAFKVPALNALICSPLFKHFLESFMRYTYGSDYYAAFAYDHREKTYYDINNELYISSDENNPDDHIRIDIDESFIKAVSFKQIDEDIVNISDWAATKYSKKYVSDCLGIPNFETD